MKVYTKTGDKGETGLFGGERVAKDHLRLEAYGTVDELNACVGFLRALELEPDIASILERVQKHLFDIGAELATQHLERLEGRSRTVSDDDVAALESQIDQWEEELTPLKNFVLPGGSESGARAHIVRTVARRAERRIVSLQKETALSPVVIRYMNRLSDFAFVLSRILNKRAGKEDIEWSK